MKVAHLDTGRDWRGGQQQIAWLVPGLAAHGVTNVVLAPHGPLFDRLAAQGVPVRAWSARGDLDVAAFAAAVTALRAERPDVVHLHSARAHAVGAAAAWIAGIRAVVASRRVAFPVGNSPWSRLKYRLPVARWLCVSEAARAQLLRAGVPAGRAIVVPSGVDLAALRAAAGRPGESLHARLGVPAGTPLLATVAALTAEKHHALLLDVAERLRAAGGRAAEARFVWLGDGPLRAPLEAAIARRGLGGRVILLGARDDVAALVAGCALLLVPSRNEGFCGAAVEAEALGVPVVATRVGGLPEVVDDQVSGVLVPKGPDPVVADAMAAAITRLVGETPLRLAMAGAARRTAARFSAENMAIRTLAAYQEVVQSHRRS